MMTAKEKADAVILKLKDCIDDAGYIKEDDYSRAYHFTLGYFGKQIEILYEEIERLERRQNEG